MRITRRQHSRKNTFGSLSDTLLSLSADISSKLSTTDELKPLPPLRGCAVMTPYDHGLVPTATRFCRFTALRLFPTSISKCPNRRHWLEASVTMGTTVPESH